MKAGRNIKREIVIGRRWVWGNLKYRNKSYSGSAVRTLGHISKKKG